MDSVDRAALDYLRAHRSCECCGRDMVCLGPDASNPPAGIWVHAHTQDSLCLHDDCLAFEAHGTGN